MTPTRQHDETLVDALALLRAGHTLHSIADQLGVDRSNLGTKIKEIRKADAAYSGEDVSAHYPIGKVGRPK